METLESPPQIKRRKRNTKDFSVCLFGFNVAFKYLRSYHDGACF